MTLTIDASVALKWVLAEEGSDRALALVGATALVAPDFLMLECANVLAQQVRRKLLTADQADFFVRELGAVDVRLVSSASLVPQAHRSPWRYSSPSTIVCISPSPSRRARPSSPPIDASPTPRWATPFTGRLSGGCRRYVQGVRS